MNGAPPDWQDGECCFRCRLQFNLVARKHHCRNCGNIFCAKCSAQSIPLPSLNLDKAVRVCDGCYEKLTGKEADPLTATLDSKAPETKSAAKSDPKTSSSSKSSTGNIKPAANASAPSEQELREEEELQLALALSLSEAAPTKISFPDCRQHEEVPISTASTTTPATVKINHVDLPVVNNVVSHQPAVQATAQAVEPPQQYIAAIEKQHPPSQIPIHYSQDHKALDGDQELFRFVAEVQSTAEVFTNRINSNKARNRPVKDDPAIQSLFLKLTDMHARLLDYIKVHDEERATCESLQDKLSQISDARAALDALREEHQEKVRQEAAEAERQRQSQLALKLEMMRQKKSQMMQYQREVALQRIQAQEMMLRQPQPGYQPPSTSVPQQVVPNSQASGLSQPQHESQTLEQPVHIDHVAMQQPPVQPAQHQTQHAPMVQQQLQQQPVYQPPYSQPGQQYATQQVVSAPGPTQHQHNQAIQQQFQPPVPKQEEEALLISFDD